MLARPGRMSRAAAAAAAAAGGRWWVLIVIMIMGLWLKMIAIHFEQIRS
jgi:hypothetical protein